MAARQRAGCDRRASRLYRSSLSGRRPRWHLEVGCRRGAVSFTAQQGEVTVRLSCGAADGDI